jgi:hypothetical protein
MTKFPATIALLSITSCAYTLEETRAQVSLSYSAPAQRDVKRCEHLSDWADAFGIGAVSFGIAAGASGVGAWPAKSETTEQTLTWIAGGAGILAAGAAEGARRLTASWNREGCAK